MADKTFGVKVSEELNDRVKQMVEASGISTKEWFEKAVALTETNAIKQGATDYQQDLSELEVHTTRIYELISNMVQRSVYIKDHAVKELDDKLQQKESIIGEYQEKTKSAIEEAKAARELLKGVEQEKNELSKQLEDQRVTNENNQLLIHEYKEKNDTLSGLVAKYQGYAEENEQLKEQFSTEREQLQSQVKEISIQNDGQQDELKELKQQLQLLKDNHTIELERISEKKDFEREKALLEVEKEQQKKFLDENEKYNDKINRMYVEMNEMRKEYEYKIEQQKQEHDKLKQPINKNQQKS